MQRKREKFGIIELFAGIGGVAQGFERAGCFEAVVLTDADTSARDTFIENFPNSTYLRRKVQWLTTRGVLDAADGRSIVGLVGCPPCQGFSAAGLRDVRDERNGLLAHYFRLLLALKPAFFVMENVPGVLDFELFKRSLDRAECSYQTWQGTLNAALFGLPQTRQRAIVIGYRRDLDILPTAPTPTHFGRRLVFDYTEKRLRKPTVESADALLGTSPEIVATSRRAGDTPGWMHQASNLADLVVVGEAIGDLPPAREDDEPAPYLGAGSAYACRVRAESARNHRRWGHGKDLLKRLAAVPEGGGLLDNHKRSAARPYFSQAYSRLHRHGLARTITTNFHNPGSGRFLHYATIRTLTVREAARLQGIADSFTFIGSQGIQERLVGNAFPIPLAEALARHIAGELGSRLTA